VKVGQAITDAFERADLFAGQGARFERSQAEFADAATGIAGSEQGGSLGVDPGGKTGQRGEMVINGGRGKGDGAQGGLPTEHVAAHTRRKLVMAVDLFKIRLEAAQMQSDLGGHQRCAHAFDRVALVVRDPRGEAGGSGQILRHRAAPFPMLFFGRSAPGAVGCPGSNSRAAVPKQPREGTFCGLFYRSG